VKAPLHFLIGQRPISGAEDEGERQALFALGQPFTLIEVEQADALHRRNALPRRHGRFSPSVLRTSSAVEATSTTSARSRSGRGLQTEIRVTTAHRSAVIFFRNRKNPREDFALDAEGLHQLRNLSIRSAPSNVVPYHHAAAD